DAFGDHLIAELRSEEMCAWRGTLPEGHRFEATQALRQVLNAAVAWELIEARRSESVATLSGEATVRVVAADQSSRLEARRGDRADGRVRCRDRAPAGRVGRARAARHRPHRRRRLRPPP